MDGGWGRNRYVLWMVDGLETGKFSWKVSFMDGGWGRNR